MSEAIQRDGPAAHAEWFATTAPNALAAQNLFQKVSLFSPAKYPVGNERIARGLGMLRRTSK